MRRQYVTALFVAVCALLFALVPFAGAAAKESSKQLQIPHCTRSIGTLAVIEPQTKWWQQYQLGSPEAIIKYYASTSGCFRLVDRGAGMEAAERERALAAAGVLRQRSNIGKGQVKAADYVLTPDLVSSNSNAGGSAITGILGAVMHSSAAGAILSGISFSSKTAQVTLSLIDVRSSEADRIVYGEAKKTDVGWMAGGGAASYGGGFGAVAGGSYANTEIGKVIASAYLDAFNKLVTELGGLPENAAEAAPKAAVEVTAKVNLRVGPSIKEAVLRSVAPGDLLYPTGHEAQGWEEVQDESGSTGWVNTQFVRISR